MCPLSVLLTYLHSYCILHLSILLGLEVNYFYYIFYNFFVKYNKKKNELGINILELYAVTILREILYCKTEVSFTYFLKNATWD